MRKKNAKSMSKKRPPRGETLGSLKQSFLLQRASVMANKNSNKTNSKFELRIHILGSEVKNVEQVEEGVLGEIVEPRVLAILKSRKSDLLSVESKVGPLWILRPRKAAPASSKHRGKNANSPYGFMRDRVGQLWNSLREYTVSKNVLIQFHGCNDQELRGALVGVELAHYRFTAVMRSHSSDPTPNLFLMGANAQQLKDARAVAEGVNLARHLVNLDASKLNPQTYSTFVTQWFKGKPGVEVTVWNPERVKKERMDLLYAVGQGASVGSHMVHIRYRPKKGKPKFQKSIAFVGKGVTFDTGGLDIKPASGMRLMKKDMGGSASVVGLAHWLCESQSSTACDIYLGLAENAVSHGSFKPGDVIMARNGLTVEIHNTDAEGRLVMADVLDVAQESAPLAVIDLSTLTGAMRVAVGAEIAGMFANQDSLAEAAFLAGVDAGDYVWRMPLWENYRGHLKSSFADLANASDSGFAGAISAALFLERFIKEGTPWLHFDLYCWTDRAMGAYGDLGGNGQGVQMLAHLLDRLSVQSLA